MKMKSVTISVLLVLVLGLVAGAGSVFAAGPAAGSGPDSAAAPQATWQPLAVSQRMWYAFNYAGDGSQIEVTMQEDPAESVNLGVWTPDGLTSWQATGVESPIGQGTPNDALGGALDWSGSFPTAGTYYVVVDQAGNVPGNYLLTITGSGVSFPAPAKAAVPAATAQVASTKAAASTETTKAETSEISKAETAESAAVAKAETAKTETTAEQTKETSAAESTETKTTTGEMAAAITTAAATGAGSDNAIMSTGNDQGKALQPGQVRWYTFEAAGNEGQVTIQLTSDPAGAATFSVWTQDELQQWGQTGVENPVGRSTPNDQFNGNQFWTGNFVDAGKYYVRVEQAGSAPVNSYQLQITQ